MATVPNLSSDQPETFLQQCILDPDTAYISVNNSRKGRLHHLTNVSKLEMKDVVLLCDDPSALKSLLKATKYVSLMPFSPTWSKRLSQRDLHRKNVHVCLNRKSLENKEYMSFLKHLLEVKKKEYGKENTVLKTKALLFEEITLPNELSDMQPIKIHSDLTPENIATFLEGSITGNYNAAVARVQELGIGPRQKIFMQPTLAGIDNDGYLTRSFHAILECFEDVGHYTRQQLRELLHIPNVQTLRSESDAHRHEICLELQPNNLDDYLELVRFVQTGQFQTSVENNVKVGEQTFLGTIDVRLEHSSTLNVLKYFCPDVFRRNARRLKELVKQDKLDEMTTLVKRPIAADMKTGGRVASLRVMCATEIYVSILTSNDSSPFEYLRQVKKLGCPDFLTEIRTSDGYNALHLAVLEKKEEFLKMLFYANKWTALGNDFVKPVNVSQECPHNGYSPRRLAEALSYTNAGYEMLLMFDEYDRLMRYMPDLHKACLMGCLQFAVAMIESRHHLIEVKDEQNANCLFYASASGNAKLVNFLLKKGAPRNTQNTVGETSLHIAAMFGHLDVLEVMSNYFFEIRGTVNMDGYNAVCYAARFGDMDTLKLYKQKGFTIDALALTTAVKYQQDGVFKFILADVKDVNKGADKEGRLALHHAVITGNAHAVKELLSKGADLSKLDKYGRNVFHLAAEFGRKDIVNILLNEAKKTGKKCLETLIGARDVLNIGELLVVVRGKDCGRKAWHVVQLNRWSTKAFQRAMKSGQIDVIKYGQILRSGFGKAADEETRKMIEKRKEDVLNNRHEDMTPLHIAAMQDNVDIVKILLSSGAPSAVQDYYGATPAHYAAMNDNATLMDLLCQAGARLDVKTNDGLTALQVAEINSSALVINYIKASQPIREARTLRQCLFGVKQKLNQDSLQKERRSGNDVRRYIIEQMRNFQIDLNQILVDLDSGPVQEESLQ